MDTTGHFLMRFIYGLFGPCSEDEIFGDGAGPHALPSDNTSISFPIGRLGNCDQASSGKGSSQQLSLSLGLDVPQPDCRVGRWRFAGFE